MIEEKQLARSVVSDEACAHIDEADVRVGELGSCVLLEIGHGSKAPFPLLLSAAASRELAASLIKAADEVEPCR